MILSPSKHVVLRQPSTGAGTPPILIFCTTICLFLQLPGWIIFLEAPDIPILRLPILFQRSPLLRHCLTTKHNLNFSHNRIVTIHRPNRVRDVGVDIGLAPRDRTVEGCFFVLTTEYPCTLTEINCVGCRDGEARTNGRFGDRELERSGVDVACI